MKRRTFTVTTPGQRLDKFLCQTLSISRRDALRLLEQNIVKLNTQPVTQRDKGRLLAYGNTLELGDVDAVLSARIVPEPDAPLSLLAEGDGYIVADKPARQAVMPLRGDETGTLLNALVARYPELQGVGEGGLRSGVVHRLDTDTSGTLAVATTQESWQILRTAFKEHRTTKLYHAIVQGQLWGEGQEQMHLTISQHRPAKVKVTKHPSSTSRQCDLSWRALETFEHASLLEIRLGTGFLHQIRVMFAHKGHPVIGDKTYGEGSRGLGAAFGAKRQMLHATFLKVEAIEAHSPHPPDFASMLGKLKGL